MNKKGRIRKRPINILCVIPSLPSDLHCQSIRSVLSQTVPVDMIALLTKKAEGETVAEKVSAVLNEGLSHVRIEDFDYIFRVDGDAVIPPNFLEENLKDKPDLCGKAGYAMLIKTSTFVKIMNGKFHPKNDDNYLYFKFIKEKCRIVDYKVKPILLRKPGEHHGIDYFFNRGKLMYKLGYEPFDVFASFKWAVGNIFAIFGYFVALIERETKFDIADFVWHEQVKTLLSRARKLYL